MTQPEILPVLIAGGRGTRFWPLSRKNKPKPLLCLTSDKPLISCLVEHLKPISSYSKIFLATSKKLAPEIKKILPKIPSANYLLEPEPRDTAPAIGLSLALLSRKIDPKKSESVLAFIPSDQHTGKPAQFYKILKSASQLAQKKDLIVTIGVKPSFPNIAYGYIQPDKPIPGFENAFQVKCFKEKPNLKKAQQYLKKGFFWNSGIFIARPSVLWKAFEEHLPEFFKRLKKISLANSQRLNSIIQTEFPRLKKISFDYAVMEKAKNVAVLASDFGWADIGSFGALDQLLGKHRIKNLGKAKLIQRKCDQLLVHTEKLIATIGVKNLVIIETKDAILIMNRNAEKELKELVQEMERLGLEQYL